MRGGQTFVINPKTRFCRVMGRGMWTPQDARAHFADIELALRPLRESARPVIFLVDMRDAQVQSAETARAMSEGAARLHHPTDVVAVVTRTILHALQVSAMSDVERLATFQDMTEAMIWARRTALRFDPTLVRESPATACRK